MVKSLNSVEILGKLVSFNTISERSNRTLINFIQDYLKSYNIASDVAWNKEGTKADLIATIGPMVEGGILLSGHTDVVPVSGQEWSSDPFKMIRNGDRLYGRGTCDMKGFLAVVLALISQFTKLDLKIPIHLAFSYDEELGCLGAPALISRLCMKIPRPRAAIIGEPTGMKLVNAHKGITLYETTIKGISGHSSQVHLGVNANLYGAKYIKFLEEFARELVSAGHKDLSLIHI